jgi:hypothetical protein
MMTATMTAKATIATAAAAAIRFTMKAGGYLEGAPNKATDRIDREVCESSSCEACGHVGLQFLPFSHQEASSYIAYAICPACGEASEF